MISRRSLIIGAGALLSACNQGSSSPPPRPVPPQVSGDIDLLQKPWAFAYGSAQPALRNGLTFDIPSAGDIHYLMSALNLDILGKSSIVLNWTVTSSADVVYAASDSGESCPCHVSIALQEIGDNYTGQGVYQFYRWFSHDKLSLDPGSHTYSIPLDPNSWGPVGGVSGPFPVTPAQGFSGCLANCQSVMLTFGGKYFAGHGLRVAQGTSTLSIDKMIITA